MSPARLQPGTILDGKYRVGRVLGKGGMGAVYLATHLGTTRTVALKVIVPELAARDEFVLRFRREAEAAGRLRHPNVVNVTDFGLTKAGGASLAYLVMEYLDGQTLAEYQSANGRPSVDLVVDIVEQIALALDAAHQAGIVHRDLKPDNVWLESNRRGGYNVKVLDFGIAKLAAPVASAMEMGSGSPVAVEDPDTIPTMAMVPLAPATPVVLAVEAGGDSPIAGGPDTIPTLAMAPIETTASAHLETRAGTLLGTPSYMSPEQCRGEAVDYRSDIYGLATIAYEMLTGVRPFQGGTLAELMRLQIEEPAIAPRERNAAIPKPLSDAVLRGLDKNPANRPRSAGTLAALIRAGAEAEFSVMRQARDVFNSNTSYFLPAWALCFSPAVLVMALMLLATPLALKTRVVPESAIAVGIWAISLCAILFCLQLFKATTTLLLGEAASSKSFRPAAAQVAKRLFSRLPEFARTQAASLADLRWSSYRDNLLWPVVWAQEGHSGRDALARSRELCRTVPAVTLTMVPRQYSPALVAVLVMPAIIGGLSGEALATVLKQMFSGGSRWVTLELLLFPLAVYMRYGTAFPFLYWFAVLCRGEGAMPSLPAAGLRPEKKRNPSLQPVQLFWGLAPVLMAALIVVSPLLHRRSTALRIAMSEGRSAAILKEIDAGASADASDLSGWTALHGAVQRGDGPLAEALLIRGSNVNARANSGATPLIVAADNNRADLAAMLLSHGALVAAAGEDGRTALIMAAMRGNAEIVALLLAHGADPASGDNAGKTALDYAREEGHADVLRLLGR